MKLCVQSPWVFHLFPYSIVSVYYIRNNHAGQMKVRAINLFPYSIVSVCYIRKNHAGQMKVRAITIGTSFISLFHCVRVLH